MGVIWTPGERAGQPSGAPRIDWGNPFSRSLALAINGNDPRRNVAQNASVHTQNGMGTKVGRGGVGLAQPSASASGVRVDSGGLLVGSGGNYTGMTVLILANPTNAPGWLMGLCLSATSGVEWYIGFGVAVTGAPSGGTFNVNTWNGTGVDVSGACDGREHVFAVTFPEGAGTTASAYVDGVKTTGTAANALPASNSAAYVGGYWANGYAVNGFSQYLTLGFNRELSATEVQRLSRNPWQLFEADNDPVFYSLGGGGVTIAATTGAAVAAGLGATAASPITIAGAVGAAIANDYAATVSSAITVAASPGAAAASDYAANVASAITVAGSVGAAVGAGLSASVSSGATISATTGAAIGAGLAAGVASPITVAASVGAATASGLSAGISTGNEIAAGTGSAVGAGLAAIVSSPITVAGSVGAATAAGLHATVSTGATVPAGLGAAIALGLTGNVAGQIIIPAALGRALAAGLQSSITVGDEIAASVGAATAAGLAATVANPTVALTAATGTRGGYGVQMQLAARRAQIQTGRRRN